MSYRTLSPKTLNATVATLLKRSVNVGIGLGALTPILAAAGNPVLPSGGVVAAGTATIGAGKGNGLVVKQSSSSAIINWQQFNIGQGDYVQFLQPSSSSVILNRVIGGSPSSILGNLTANGQVFLVNTNGVYFGKTASLDAQGFLASTLDITDANFLAGDYLFDQPSSPGAQVNNQGHIQAHAGGYVVLAGDYANNSGIISAQAGHIILASGAKDTLTLSGNHLINFAVDQATLANYAGVRNTGRIIADGGTVIMTADVANALKATVVNNLGLIEATTLNKTGSAIYLTATGGDIENAGTLDADATRAGLAGGDITLKGDERTTLTDTSKIYATGDAAEGGSVEVSGNIIALRGAMALGKGGKLMLDPTSVEIIAGATGTAGAAGTGGRAGGLSGGSSTKLGLAFIEGRLNSNASVEIEAKNKIYAGSSVKAIKATGNGLLDMFTEGAIKLKGVNITIGGELMAGAINGNESFGYLQAGAMSLTAYGAGAVISLPKAVVNKSGMVTTYSAKTTGGNLTVVAADVKYASTASSSAKATLAFKATGKLSFQANAGDNASDKLQGNLVLQGQGVKDVNAVFMGGGLSVAAGTGSVHINKISAGGNVTVTADGPIQATGIHGAKNITLSAKSYAANGVSTGLSLSAGGSLTVDGSIGHSANAAFDGPLKLIAGKTIKVDHSLFVKSGFTSDYGTPTALFHDVTIQGAHLDYTGAGKTFTISAGYGLHMGASIGSAAAPVGYNVHLKDNGYGIYIQRSIYTQGSIAVAQTKLNASGLLCSTNCFRGVEIGSFSSTPITVSAKRSVSLAGHGVYVGGRGPITITAGGAKSSTSSGDLRITADWVNVEGSSAHASNTSLDHAVSLHAGHDVDIHADSSTVYFDPAKAIAEVSGTDTKAVANTSISVTAGNDINISAKTGVVIGSAEASAYAKSDSKKTAAATATANVTFTAGGSIDIVAPSVVIGRQGAQANVTTALKAQKATATASADISITAGRGLDFSGSTRLEILAGNSVAGKALIKAGSSSAAAVGVAHADVTLAGQSVTLSGKNLELLGGRDAGGAMRSYTTHNSGATHSSVYHPGTISASGKHAAAALTATANLTVNAGAGGLLLAGSEASIFGGSGAGAAERILTGSHATATEDAEAKIALTTSGNLTVNANALRVRGGGSAGGVRDGSHHSPVTTTYSFNKTELTDGVAGDINLTVDSSLSLKAGGNLMLRALSSDLEVSAGEDAGDALVVQASHGGAVGVNLDAALSLTAGKNLQLTAQSASAYLYAGGYDLAYSEITAKAGAKVTIAGSDGAQFTAGANLGINGESEVDMGGGGHGGYETVFTADSAGSILVSAQANLGLTAKGSISLVAQDYSEIEGGSEVAADGVHSATQTGSKVTLTGQGGVSFKAGGNISLTELGSEMYIEGGGEAGNDNTLTGSSGGATKLTGDAAISIDAGGNFLASVADDEDLGIHGGSEAGAEGDLTAKKLGSVTLAADAGVHISATGNLTLRAGDDLGLYGYHYAGYDHTIVADSGGKISETALANLSLTAGGNFTAAGYETSIEAGNYAGYDNTITVDGHGSKFTGTGDGGVAITAGGNVSLTARYYGEIAAGSELAYEDTINASGGGSAQITGRDAVSIKAAGNVTASAGSDGLYVYTKDYVGDDAHITAVDATGKIAGDGGVYITAGGGVKIQSAKELVIEAEGEYTGASDILKSSVTAAKLTAGASVTALAGFNVNAKSFSALAQSDLDLYAGYKGYTGYDDSVTALNKGAKSAVSADAGVHITTTGAVALTGNYDMHLSAGYGGGEGADAKASHSGSANVSLHEDLTITAGGAVTVKVAPYASSSTYGVFIRTIGDYVSNDNDAAYDAQAKAATHGVANLVVDAGVSIVAKGAVNIAAGNNLVVQGGEYVAAGDTTATRAEAQASSGGVANLSAEASIRIQGASIQLTAGDSMSLLAGRYAAAYYTKAYALTGGKATLTGSAGVAFTATGGAFSAAAGKELTLEAGNETGYLGAASASGAKATANLVANAAATVSARTVSLTASGSLGIYAASAGYEAHGLAKAGGKASQTDNAGVNITAATAFTAALTGFASGNDLEIGGDDAGYEAVLTASSGAVTANYLSNVNIKVTGLGGTLTLKTGSQRSTSIDIYAGSEGAYYSVVTASAKGVVTLGANQSVALSARGAVSISAGHGSVDIYAGSQYNAKDAEALAKGSGAKATLDLVTSLNISGGNVAIKAHGTLYVYGGYKDQALGALASGTNGGVAGMSIDGQTNITAAGTLNMTAGEGIYVYGGKYPNASGAQAIAKNKGQASLVTSTDLNLKAGGAMTLTAGGSIGIYGDSDLAKGAKASASDSAGATLAATGNVSITAAAFTAGAGGSLYAEAGVMAGSAAKVIAHGTGAVANATYAANVSIATGGGISLKTLGGKLYVAGESEDAYAASVDATSGGAATLSGQARASLNAGGAVTLTAYSNIGLSAGYDAAELAKVDGVTGKAKLSTDTSVSITAGTNLTLRSLAGGSAGVYGGGAGLEKATLLGSGSHATATATINQIVSLSAGDNLAFESMGAITWRGGAFPASGSRAGVTAAVGGKASATVTATVTLKAGGELSTSVTPDKTSSLAIDANGLVETNTVKDSGHPVKLSFSPLAITPQAFETLSLEGVSSFGGLQSLGNVPTSGVVTPNVGTALSLPGGVVISSDTTDLGNLQDTGLVMSLVPVLTPALTQTATLFAPSSTETSAFPHSCAVVLVRDGAQSCRVGGK